MSSKIVGLTSAQVESSLELYGDNSLKKEKTKGFVKRFFENLSDPIIRILLIALVIEVAVTLGKCNFVEIGGILAAILISTSVSTISEYRSERAFARLEERSVGTVTVERDGKLKIIPSTDLVVGDIVYLSPGQHIHADSTVLSGRITVDQSALNGESAECIKIPGREDGWDLNSSSRVFRGTVVTDGEGVVRVGRVGKETYYGMVAKDVQSETRISPLKLRLGRLAKQVSRLGYIIAILVGLAYLFNSVIVDNGFSASSIFDCLSDGRYMASLLLHTLTLMITVVVVAAPEGLPMMITVILSANMKRMLSDKVHVKKLVGIDTAGSLNILFTDKTGTLTVGRPQCESIITAAGTYHSVQALSKAGDIYKLLLQSAKLNTDVTESDGELIGGNSTDRAIYEFFIHEKLEYDDTVSKISFSSENKFSSVTLKNGKSLIKGAAEIILNRCNMAVKPDGSLVPLNLTDINGQLGFVSAKGARVIAVAILDPKMSETPIFVGLVVLRDKIRRGVPDAVRRVIGAGIQVVMITGDGKETAIAIGRECGIYSERAGHIALGSEELHHMSDEEIKQILPRLRIISRALPQDKTRLVRLSQELELVAGMTGDGINDAPSLKLADVGFAMGSGTDIAKSASDIVILDDSFFAICKTVLYGRTIFKSIRKFITFQLVMNLAACGISLVGQFVGIDTPITIIQMLWVNIIMDTLGGLAFAGEPPLEYYMREAPIKRDEPILSKEMYNHIILSGLYTFGVCLLFLTSYVFRGYYGFSMNPDKFYTAFYALFIFAGIFNCFLARSDRLWLLSNISKNIPFVIIMLMISVIQIFMIYFGGAVFRCVPLTAGELMLAIGIAFTVVPFDIARRTIYRLK